MTLLKRAMNTGRIKAKVGGPAVRALPLIAIALALAVLAALGPDGQRLDVHAQAGAHESITSVTLSANELSEGAGTQTITLNVTMDTPTRVHDTPLSSRGARLCVEGVGAQKGEDGDFTSTVLVPAGSENLRSHDVNLCRLFTIDRQWGSEFHLKVRVNILEDTIDEPYEDIRFTLQNGVTRADYTVPDPIEPSIYAVQFISLSGSSAELTIRDNDGLAGPTVSDQRTHEDQPFALTFPAVVDPQGITVSYTAALADGSPLPDWLTFNADTRTFSGTPDDIGIWPIRVTASGSGYPGTSIFNLTVFTDVPLGQVANLRQHENGTDYVTLHWDPTPKADRYLVQWREPDAQFSLAPEWSATVSASDSPGFTISELPSGVTLQVRVTAQRDTVPDGPESAELQVSTQGAARSFNDYDADDDGLIEISNLEQLNAIRWDLDGDGDSDHDGYAAAFPDPAANNVAETAPARATNWRRTWTSMTPAATPVAR